MVLTWDSVRVERGSGRAGGRSGGYAEGLVDGGRVVEAVQHEVGDIGAGDGEAAADVLPQHARRRAAQTVIPRPLDCFASLAMTEGNWLTYFWASD